MMLRVSITVALGRSPRMGLDEKLIAEVMVVLRSESSARMPRYP